MAIGLSNVDKRKVKRTQTTRTPEASKSAALAVELKTETKASHEAWSTRGLAREGRSVQRERKLVSGDINTTWMDWTACVTGTETSTRLMRTVRRLLDLESSVFEFLAR